MPLPTGVQTGTFVGEFVDVEGTPRRGWVVITPSTPAYGSAVAVIQSQVRKRLDQQGHFEALVVATDNLGLNPDNWTYEIRLIFDDGVYPDPFSYQIEPDTTVDVTTAIPVAPVGSVSQYALKVELSHYHVQTLALLTWPITHNLGYKPGGIEVETTARDRIEFFKVNHLSNNALELTFGAAMSGYAYLS